MASVPKKPATITALGKRIRRLRKAGSLTIEALAERAGIGAVFLGSLERGKGNPSLNTLQSVAAALGISVSKLVDIDEDLDDGATRALIERRVRSLTPTEAQLLLRVVRALKG